ncbi:methyltransferase domain-containing protein [Rhodocytophaga aerolata]|uniref:Methyltransferase domain-containing protein n=1 Tax=Rhodocytophaga aerolata TaxID=455078 RepID=A0ABT8R1F4_9BACT|nr:class I SAM-dependent methyltransferase [Rhodocytophaga aerolata]MDO1445148.1 methyltransferase domain-containing protein [Rhodocytophaga aerolata]
MSKLIQKKSAAVYDNLICVKCNTQITEEASVFDQEYFSCTTCNSKYPVINNIPIILDERRSIFKNKDFLEQKNLFFDISKRGKLKTFISHLIPSNSSNWYARKNYQYLTDSLLQMGIKKPKILIVGGSIAGNGMKEFLANPALNIVESDVSFGERTQIIFDCHAIPYQNETFDCIVAQAVLEHVINPQQCVKEIFRVLKPNGFIYIETPFMQQVHGGAYDFTRYTHSGHRYLLRNFDELKSGATAGPGTVMLWSYEYLFKSLFGFSEPIRLFLKAFTRLTGFWLKYIDLLCRWNPHSKDAASGFYFIGKKSTKTISDEELIQYYHNNLY